MISVATNYLTMIRETFKLSYFKTIKYHWAQFRNYYKIVWLVNTSSMKDSFPVKHPRVNKIDCSCRKLVKQNELYSVWIILKQLRKMSKSTNSDQFLEPSPNNWIIKQRWLHLWLAKESIEKISESGRQIYIVGFVESRDWCN